MPNYPGLGLPVRHNPQGHDGHYPIGAHGSCWGSRSHMLPVREVAMMSIMDTLTDKEGWEKKVWDDEIVSKWRKDALAIPDEHFLKLVTREKIQRWNADGTLFAQDDWVNPHRNPLEGILTASTFDCCIKELRSKAIYFEKSGIIPTLDACASVAKSDTLVSQELHEELSKAFEKLKTNQAHAPDWHPNSNDMVQDLVHPSMYPLVYGRSRVLQDEVVGVDDAIEKWAGKGSIIRKDHSLSDAQRNGVFYSVGGNVPPQYWSDTYQWLPANVAFQDDGTVKLTSYINNLHPRDYPEIYRTIERFIETSLPAWDQCLGLAIGYHKKTGAGRIKPRFQYPENPGDENYENWEPFDPQKYADVKINWKEMRYHPYDPRWDDDAHKKWEFLRKPVIPEPSFEDVDYAPEPGERLAEKFAKSGLQVIVKMASIELTPDKPEFPVGAWHIEGQMNENICATSLYYIDCENVTTSNLSFRMQASAYDVETRVGQDAYQWLEKIYGTSLGGGVSPCLQNYGSVETRQGRLLAFPNVFQHRVSSFRLKDPTKPGRRSFIACWLVDPTKRIISTANVPPQQMDWWLNAFAGTTKEDRDAVLSRLPAEVLTLMKDKGLKTNISPTSSAKLPQELMDIVGDYFNVDGAGLPMSLQEAKEHRIKLMEARSSFVKTAEEGWQQHSYNFCEH